MFCKFSDIVKIINSICVYFTKRFFHVGGWIFNTCSSLHMRQWSMRCSIIGGTSYWWYIGSNFWLKKWKIDDTCMANYCYGGTNYILYELCYWRSLCWDNLLLFNKILLTSNRLVMFAGYKRKCQESFSRLKCTVFYENIYNITRISDTITSLYRFGIRTPLFPENFPISICRWKNMGYFNTNILNYLKSVSNIKK